ncbi:MAG: substrate-binding domain-containing protein [Fimbriimonas sp.]|nr:substrate-binding domain-containing protein [Fimbriimonas sp.]
MKLGLLAMAAVAAVVLAGCGSDDKSAVTSSGSGGATEAKSPDSLPLVAFAQANSADPWRQQFDAETKEEVGKHTSEFRFEEQPAEDDASKQIGVIETFLVKSPKVLLVSPVTVAVQSAVEKAYDAKIPVILLDRGIPGDKYTVHVGGDNVDIGRQAGEYIAKRLNGKGTVLMIQGLGGVDAADDRRNGAMESFKKYPGIKVIMGDDCKFQRLPAQNFMETFLQKGQPFDAVYAHNDEMAIGAYQAYDHAATKPKVKPIFVGIDGCQKEVVQMIKDGKLDATFRYPDPGPKGIEIAADILKGKMPTDKKVVLPTVLVTKETADQYLKDNPNLAK